MNNLLKDEKSYLDTFSKDEIPLINLLCLIYKILINQVVNG